MLLVIKILRIKSGILFEFDSDSIRGTITQSTL